MTHFVGLDVSQKMTAVCVVALATRSNIRPRSGGIVRLRCFTR